MHPLSNISHNNYTAYFDKDETKNMLSRKPEEDRKCKGAAEHYHFIIIKISTILYEYMFICLLVCKITSK
jgi:hypothetical protein